MLDCGTCPAHFGRKTCCHHQNIPRLSWLKYYLSLISWYQEAKEPVPSPSTHHVDGSLHTKYFPHTEGQVLVQLHQRPQGWVAPHYSLPHLLLSVGQETLCAAGEGESRVWYPSVWETVPAEARDLKKEIGKIEDQMLSRKRQGTPLTPVIPQAHDQ